MGALEDRLQPLVTEARREGLEANLVIRTHEPLPTGDASPTGMAGAGAIIPIAQKVGFGEVSVANPDVEVYPPWRPTEEAGDP